MLTVGLTGGIGTGKSTVANMFKSLGARVLNVDKMAHRLLYRNSPCFDQVVKKFGKQILVRGSINRKKLAAIVFNNPKQLKALERIIHPQLRKHTVAKLKELKQRSRYKVVIIDIPLLFEAGFDKLVDCIIVVKANQNQQIKRAQHQLKITEHEVKRRIQAQIPLEKKIRLADIIIDNSGNKTKTKKQVNEIWRKLPQKRMVKKTKQKK